MHERTIILFVTAIITTLLLLIVALFCASVVRRGLNQKKYRKLDRLRATYRKQILDALRSHSLNGLKREFTARPRSLRGQAMEDVLMGLIGEEEYRAEIIGLFSALGYVSFYEKRISCRNVQKRALSIDKLGKMQNRMSVPKVAPLLEHENREVATVAVRSLSKIGGRQAMDAIIERLPLLLDGSRVAGKALEADLSSFGPDIIPALTDPKVHYANPVVVASILETLSRLGPDPRSVRFATQYLSRPNAELRSKAVKVLGVAESLPGANVSERILSMLDDPVWFVRLQAVRSLRSLHDEQGITLLKKLVFDEKWQVRNEAVRALIILTERPLDILFELLTSNDRYAKDSVCEEIENTDFCTRMIESLEAHDFSIREKSRRVLQIMHANGFSTPLRTYLERGMDHGIKEQIRALMKRAVVAS